MTKLKMPGSSLVIFITCAMLISCGSRSDEDIRKDVNETLSAGSATATGGYAKVQTSVMDGVVTLGGQCEGENCADSVVAKVNEVDGVKEVVNNIQETRAAADLTLRTSVQSIISKYQGVQADVAEGVVVLRGTISRDQVQPLMNELQNLRPTKIDNQLAIQ